MDTFLKTNKNGESSPFLKARKQGDLVQCVGKDKGVGGLGNVLPGLHPSFCSWLLRSRVLVFGARC